MRKLSPELDPLRIGTGWKPSDLEKAQIFIESTFGDSHPGSGHLDKLVEAAREGVEKAGGHGAPIALVEEGDLIRLDIKERALEIVGIHGKACSPEEVEAVLAERKKAWKPRPVKYRTGVLRLFSELAVSPMKGAYISLD